MKIFGLSIWIIIAAAVDGSTTDFPIIKRFAARNLKIRVCCTQRWDHTILGRQEKERTGETRGGENYSVIMGSCQMKGKVICQQLVKIGHKIGIIAATGQTRADQTRPGLRAYITHLTPPAPNYIIIEWLNCHMSSVNYIVQLINIRKWISSSWHLMWTST